MIYNELHRCIIEVEATNRVVGVIVIPRKWQREFGETFCCAEVKFHDKDDVVVVDILGKAQRFRL